jgi:hypothetical protein
MLKSLEKHVVEANDNEENIEFAIDITSLAPFNYGIGMKEIVPKGLEEYAFGLFLETLHLIAIHLAEMWNEKHPLIPVLLLKKDNGTVLSSFKTK